MDLVSLKGGSNSPMINDLGWHEVELDVGMRHSRITSDKASCLEMSSGCCSCPPQEPLNANLISILLK